MKNEWQKKPPFSFHLNGAFNAGFLEVYSGYEPIGGEITEEYVISQLCRADERVDEILRDIPNIASFERKLDESGGLTNRPEKLLCRISFGDFGGALDFLESEKSAENSGMYHSVSGGSFYDMAEKYCKDKLKE